jgi:DNA invertase Pin-like site-specific DNA recombinase
MNKYIAYYRVSTKTQGKSGLGLSSQQEMVKHFLKSDDKLIREYQEVESGKNNKRTKLLKAIQDCKENGYTLLIAKLDRLSRDTSFIFTLKNSNVKFICADMPDANSLTIGIMAVLAEDEAKRISDRTKSALREIKRKIEDGKEHISKSGNVVTKLGYNNLTQDARMKGVMVRVSNSNNNTNNIKAGGYIVSLKQQGMNLKEISSKLNQLEFKTSKGCSFNPIQVKRLYDKYK